MSMDYSLRFCYGIIVPEETMNEVYKVLKDFDDFYDNFANQVNSWTGGDWFVGVSKYLNSDLDSFVQEVDKNFFEIDTSMLEDLGNFLQFYDDHNLKKYFDWKPKMYLINFCY